MRLDRKIRFCAGAMAITMIASASMSATAQIVINEVVKDIRTFDAGTGAPAATAGTSKSKASLKPVAAPEGAREQPQKSADCKARNPLPA